MNKLKKFAPFAFIPVLLILLLAGKDRSLPRLKGSLSGRVINIQGEGLAKAKLLLKSRGFQKEILTDGQGAFEVPALPTGVYEITTKPSGSGRPVTQEVAIHLGRESFVTLVTREKGLEEEELSNQIPAPRYVLDDQGRVVSQETQVEDKFYYMEYSYDPYGRLKTATDNLNERWDYEYTDSGKIEEIGRTDGQSLLFNYDKDDNLWRVDLPWGYKIFYRKDENKFTKTVKKYKNLTLFEFSYTLDEKGNKVEVEEGAGLKLKYQYLYDNNDRLLEIRDMKSGEKNKSVFKRKGKILNASLFGQIILKDGKCQDRFYEYGFDERGNIIYQKNKSSPVEVVREFNRRNLLTRETYLFQSRPVLSIEYKYDIFDRLLLKSLDNGISYYYFRDKDGQVRHKVMRNMLTGEEIDGVSYTPYLSDFDQDGFELIKYKDREKLFVRDAEGNRRYRVEIFDVLRYSTHHHQRNVHTDGDFSREIEYVMREILEKINKPGAIRAFDLLREFFDLPLENPAESGEGMVQVQSAVPGEVGCYKYGYCAPQYSYCVDCGQGAGGGEEPGPGGGAPDCVANISGPALVMVNEHVTYNLSTNCYEPEGFNWGGGEGANSGTTSYTTWWTSSGGAIVTVSFSYSSETSYVWDEEEQQWIPHVSFSTASTSLDVNVFDEDEPPIIPPSGNDSTEPTIMIYYVQTPSGGGSFIADRLRTGDLIIVYGKATYGTLDVSNLIMWTFTDNPYDSIVSGTTETPWGTRGAECAFIPVPPPALTGRTGRLSYIIKAQITAGGKTREHSVTVTQDKLDELRQEYEDLWRDSQGRSNFDQDWEALPGLLGVAAESSKHNNWHILRSLNQHALDANYFYVDVYLSGGINFTSGYRCPVGNLYTPGADANSNHQYGKAFDFKQYSSRDNYNAFWAAYYSGAGVDTYLLKSDGNKVFWYDYIPPPNQVTYIQGHAAWNN
jgi:YD repeat-containing protein